MGMKIKKIDIVLGSLILLDLILCIYIGITKSNNYLCAPGSGCDFVQNSIYGALFGIRLAWFGVICFSILFILFLISRVNKNMYWMFFISSLIGAGLSLYFIGLQVFVLGKICRDCVIIDGVMILMFFAVIIELIWYKKEIKHVIEEVEDIEAKVFK